MSPKQKRNKKQKLASQFGSCCFWCRRELPLGELTIDHLIPVSKGGSNSYENLRLACRPCNREKANDLYPPYSAMLRMLAKQILEGTNHSFLGVNRLKDV